MYYNEVIFILDYLFICEATDRIILFLGIYSIFIVVSNELESILKIIIIIIINGFCFINRKNTMATPKVQVLYLYLSWNGR